ncbi:hypothetical protein CDAR_495941 [Caerostris darwini]|uniref:Uncharacterized protein n=1 Tax=Caerostris darwini TaxID=1538125 RepID=A0AAV4P2B6_9ARAC|nr:hypothetical protein CDAR_495941 [Caerostris darwini]
MEVVKVEIRFRVWHNREINVDGRNKAPSEQQTRCEITSRGSRRVFCAEGRSLQAQEIEECIGGQRVEIQKNGLPNGLIIKFLNFCYINFFFQDSAVLYRIYH